MAPGRTQHSMLLCSPYCDSECHLASKKDMSWFLLMHCLHLACLRLLFFSMASRTCFSSKARMWSFIPCLMALQVWVYSRLSPVVLPLFITLLFSHSIFVLISNLSGFSPWCWPATRRDVSCMICVMVSAVASRSSCGMSSSMLNLFNNSASNLTWCFFSSLVSILMGLMVSLALWSLVLIWALPQTILWLLPLFMLLSTDRSERYHVCVWGCSWSHCWFHHLGRSTSSICYITSWTMCWLSSDHGTLQTQPTCLLTGSFLPTHIGQCTFPCNLWIQFWHWSLPWLVEVSSAVGENVVNVFIYLIYLLTGYWWACRPGCTLAGTIGLFWWLALLLCMIDLWSSRHFLLWICWLQIQLHIGIHCHLSSMWYALCCLV